MKKNKIAEIGFGIFLIAALIGYYRICMTYGGKRTNAQPTNQVDNSRYILDTDTEDLSADLIGYYSGLRTMRAEQFDELQCGKINSTISFAQDNNESPMSICVTVLSVKESLADEELAMIKEALDIYGSSSEDWSCFLQDVSDDSRVITQDELERVSKYVFVDIELENLIGTEALFSFSQLKLLLVKSDHTWDTDFYNSEERVIVSNGVSSSYPVFIAANPAPEFVGLANEVEAGELSYYREPNRALANLKNTIYVDNTISLRLMFVCTDEEIDEGRLALCSNKGNAWRSGAFSNQGFVIDLGEDIKNAADN